MMKTYSVECGECGTAGSIAIDEHVLDKTPLRYREAPFGRRGPTPPSWDCPKCRSINALEWVWIDGEQYPTGVLVRIIEGRRVPELPRTIAELVEWARERGFRLEIGFPHGHMKTIEVRLLSTRPGNPPVFDGFAIEREFQNVANALDAAAKAAFSQWLKLNPRSPESSSG